MVEYELPWSSEEDDDSLLEIDVEEIELADETRAVSERVRHGHVTPKSRRAAAKIILTLDLRRERKGLTKAALARKLKKQPPALRRFFREDGNPELFTLIQIADALDADIVVRPRRRRPPFRCDDPEPF